MIVKIIKIPDLNLIYLFQKGLLSSKIFVLIDHNNINLTEHNN